MELNLKLKLRDVYGGDGFTRPYQVEQTKLSRSRTKTLTRQDVGVPVDSQIDEQQVEVKDDVCQTFRRAEDGTPLLRLGGTHGKLWGALKECAEALKEIKGTFASFAEIGRLMKTVRVSPIYAKLDGANGMSVEALPQVLAGRRSSMITQHFDVIPECTTKVKIAFPDPAEKKIKAMLTQLQDISCLNKRRATIEVMKK